jgi:hypothetical protein
MFPVLPSQGGQGTVSFDTNGRASKTSSEVSKRQNPCLDLSRQGFWLI